MNNLKSASDILAVVKQLNNKIETVISHEKQKELSEVIAELLAMTFNSGSFDNKS